MRTVLLIDNNNDLLGYKELIIDNTNVLVAYIPTVDIARQIVPDNIEACTVVGPHNKKLIDYLKIKCKEVKIIWSKEKVHLNYRYNRGQRQYR